jgi:glycosyltransferase involved in cell wall biosynthesis
MVSKQIIVIADARLRISPQFEDTLTRHLEYIREFRKIPGYSSSQMVVVQPSLNIFRSQTICIENLRIEKLSIARIVFLRRILNANGFKTILIVSGDPSESFLFAKIIKLLLGNNSIPIQAQVHGEYSQAWARLSLRNRIRRSTAHSFLKSANAIRVVTEEQKRYIVETFSVNPEKIHTIPVRLNKVSSTVEVHRKCNPSSIGLVGRIHKERNIVKFAEIAQFFCRMDPDLEVIVVGASANDRKAEKSLKGIKSPNLKILGHLEGDSLRSVWSRIGVLISTAETESYGRALREALMNGVPVLALSSIGSRALQRECPEAVTLFTEGDSAFEIYELFKNLLASRVPDDFAINQRIRDLNIGSQIAISWKDAVENNRIG